MKITRPALAALGVLTMVAMWMVPGCPNRECEASGQSGDFEFTLDDAEGSRTLAIAMTVDLGSVALGLYVPFDQPDGTLTLDQVDDGDAGSVFAELSTDIDGQSVVEDQATVVPDDEPSALLSVSDLLGECPYDEVCEVVVYLDLTRADVGEFEGTVSATYRMHGDNQECRGNDFDEIAIDVTIGE